MQKREIKKRTLSKKISTWLFPIIIILLEKKKSQVPKYY